MTFVLVGLGEMSGDNHDWLTWPGSQAYTYKGSWGHKSKGTLAFQDESKMYQRLYWSQLLPSWNLQEDNGSCDEKELGESVDGTEFNDITLAKIQEFQTPSYPEQSKTENGKGILLWVHVNSVDEGMDAGNLYFE